MDFTKVKAALEKKGYTVKTFARKEEAAAYLTDAVRGKTVGFGGSVTLEQMGLYEALGAENTVYWHWRQDLPREEALRGAMNAQVYLLSVNGLSEEGEIVNIDGTGNRLAAALFGHEKVYYVAGRNKLAPDLAAALDRARNVAAPLNAKRLSRKTPCAEKADRCHDCASPERICRAASILWTKPSGMPAEVLLVDEELGY